MDAISVLARDREKRAVGRALRLALIVSVALAGVLLALLATASANTALFERHYPLLLWGNGAIALALAVLTAELVRRIARRARQRVFGTKLMIRLALAFTAMTVLPGLLIYFVAAQFLGRSIESWFDVPVDRALESGLNLGRAAFDAIQTDTLAKARRIGNELADRPPGQWQRELDRMRDQLGVQDALVLSPAGRVLLSSSAQYAQLAPDLPSPAMLQQVRLARQVAAVEGLDSIGESAEGAFGGASGPVLKVRVLRQIAGPGPGDETRLLQLVHPVPTALAANADAVSAGHRDYQQLSLSRQGLKRIFRVTLTLALLLTVFASVAAAFLLSGWLVGPLTMLAAGTRAVAEGDFRPVKDYGGRDELGVLTQSFNAMTRQLEEARAQVAAQRRDLEEAKARLERVLGSLSAGVLSFDANFRLTMANPGAEMIFGAALSERQGEPIEALPGIGPLASDIRAEFDAAMRGDADGWQRQFALGRRDGDGGEPMAADGGDGPAAAPRTLLARGTTLPAAGESPAPEAGSGAAPDGRFDGTAGLLIVFDDVSEVVSAQRTVAWNEVARRLAHEIKNPLTPIQLTAERLPRKLADKLAPADAEILRRGATTIVNQVAALARMVDDFRHYARLPSAQLAPLDLNELVREVLSLYGGVEVDGDTVARPAPVRMRLAEVPKVMGDAAQLRQVIHNLVKNAQEAAVSADGTGGGGAGGVEVSTAPARATGGAGVPPGGVRLRVRDDGPGFAPRVLERAFEPYVTGKPRGTGLGLAIVRKIVDEHGARIALENRTDADGRVLGAQVDVVFTRMAA